MTVRILFNPLLAIMLFTMGMWLGVTIHPLYGLITIIGGCLLGFSPLSREVPAMDGKSKLLFFVSLTFLFTLMSSGYILFSMFFL